MKNFRTPVLLVVFAFIASLMTDAALTATKKPGPDEKIDPKVGRLMHKIADFYAKLDGFAVNQKVSMSIKSGDQEQSSEGSITIAVQKPNRLYICEETAPEKTRFIYDGERLHLYQPLEKIYRSDKAPKSIDRLFSGESPLNELLVSPLGPRGPSPAFGMVSKPYEYLMKNAKTGQYVGLEVDDESKSHHMKFTGKTLDWEMWVKAAENPVVRKIEVDMARIVKKSATGKKPEVSMTFLFENWELNPEFEGDQFTFNPPDDAIDFKALRKEKAARRKKERKKMLGRLAPKFKLNMLDGTQLKLSSHTGKHVVCLLFWVSSSKSCYRALPVLSKMAEKYREKGVVVYAINPAESPERVKNFLERTGFDLKVAIDKKEKIAKKYLVWPVPYLVIIGKDGTVQAIHSGIEPGSAQDIAAELEKLIAGKSLVNTDKKEKGPEKYGPGHESGMKEAE
ncbi:MAG: DUF2092 domain-containing protein [Planctomycetes bacterium]|nr:DUF2092 domain-containing protein [Planctomycetota bacterium]